MAGTAFAISVDGTPTNGDNPWLDSLVWGFAWDDDTPDGVVTISYALAEGNAPASVFLFGDGKAWTAQEIAALEAAMDSWEAVANVEFVETTEANADVHYWLGSEQQVGALGWHEVPGTANEPLDAVFSYEGYGWTDDGLAAGGYGLTTIVHELGHGIGLAHPHDGGSEPDGTRFPGVIFPFEDFGLYDLNQSIFTVMSYNDGWATQYPNHADPDYGWTYGPTALDIAAVQLLYGANMTTATGNDTYTLPETNAAGTYWSAIWDAGGIDTLSAAGATGDAILNLNDAPLTGANAGGYVSYIPGIVGGFTIANGVVIENAEGCEGDDTITGNAADNTLIGNGGDDRIQGGLGDDTIYGGDGFDFLNGGEGDDVIYGDDGRRDLIIATKGHDTVTGGAGRDIIIVRGEQTVTDYDPSEDRLIVLGRGSTVIDMAGDPIDDFLF